LDRETVIRTVLVMAIVLAIISFWGPLMRRFNPDAERPSEAPRPETPAQAPAERVPAEAPSEEPAEEVPAPVLAEEVPAPVPAEAAPAVPVMKAPALKVAGDGETEAARTVVIGSARYGGDFDLKAEITPRGAAVRRLTLARHRVFKTVTDRYKKDPDEREAMDLVEPGAPFPAFGIAELRVKFAGSLEREKVDLSEAVWRIDRGKTGPTQAAFSIDVETADGKPVLTAVKTYSAEPRPVAEEESPGESPPQYEIEMHLTFTAADPRVEEVGYVLRGPPALPREGIRTDFRQAVAGLWSGGEVEVSMVPGGKIKVEKGAPAEAEAKTELAGPSLVWVGQVDKYFAVVMIPQKPSPEGTFAAGAEAFRYEVTESGEEQPLAGVRLLVQDLPIKPGEPLRHDYVIFAGPKDPDLLQESYGHLGLADLILWTRCCVDIPGLKNISKFMVVILDGFHALVRNYGLAIIMLVVVLQVVLYPVTLWSTKSMSKMQTLGPKMQALREQHGSDKQRLNQEMMRLYKEEGINPVSGCLPMVVQMPIWIGLYGALMVAINLRHAAFLPTWMVPEGSIFLQDLAQPDALIRWGTPFFIPGQSIPLLGWLIGALQGMLGGGITSFNILPFLMAGSMFLQQRMTPTPAAGGQAQQQKQMMGFMMVFMLVILYNAPSGLCLYIFTSSSLRFLEQKFLKKRFTKPREGGAVPPSPTKGKPLVSGRKKSLAERAEAWVRKRMDQGKGAGKRK